VAVDMNRWIDCIKNSYLVREGFCCCYCYLNCDGR